MVLYTVGTLPFLLSNCSYMLHETCGHIGWQCSSFLHTMLPSRWNSIQDFHQTNRSLDVLQGEPFSSYVDFGMEIQPVLSRDHHLHWTNCPYTKGVVLQSMACWSEQMYLMKCMMCVLFIYRHVMWWQISNNVIGYFLSCDHGIYKDLSNVIGYFLSCDHSICNDLSNVIGYSLSCDHGIYKDLSNAIGCLFTCEHI